MMQPSVRSSRGGLPWQPAGAEVPAQPGTSKRAPGGAYLHICVVCLVVPLRLCNRGLKVLLSARDSSCECGSPMSLQSPPLPSLLHALPSAPGPPTFRPSPFTVVAEHTSCAFCDLSLLGEPRVLCAIRRSACGFSNARKERFDIVSSTFLQLGASHVPPCRGPLTVCQKLHPSVYTVVASPESTKLKYCGALSVTNCASHSLIEYRPGCRHS
jgi:hypothetical protein